MNETSARPSGGNGKAIVIGVLAMLLGAALWAVVTVVTAHEFSLVAIGIGALVGLAMFSARPTSAGIAAVAALLTVIGCALGEFLAIPAYVAHKEGIGFGKLINLELKHPKLYFDSLDGKTYLFWAIGAAAAFSMVYRRIQASRATADAPASYGAAPAQGPGQGQGQYAPQQQYGAAPQPGAAAAQPYSGQPAYGQPAYGQGQPPYGQGQPPAPEQQPYGQNPQPYVPPQQPYGRPGEGGSYGQEQRPGQQYPPR
ncbi:MAG: hypothetical protein JWP48_575 [Actinoallomurus sp.]|jgi:hypothetical protein|nr:hypothetical protein [Actinoallomurus sp.]